MKFLDNIFSWFINTTTFNTVVLSVENVKHKYLYLDRNEVLLKYIEDKAKELAETENIKIFSVFFDELNKNELIEDKKAVGIFKYLSGDTKIQYEKINKKYERVKHISTKQHLTYPRIEITEKADVFTILHELGHYFLYKRKETQSELSADKWIEEFFDNYLPPFFKWIYQIDIKIRCKKELEFTEVEAREHWNEYNKWIKINN